jgi:hypothetical protein
VREREREREREKRERERERCKVKKRHVTKYNLELSVKMLRLCYKNNKSSEGFLKGKSIIIFASAKS